MFGFGFKKEKVAKYIQSQAHKIGSNSSMSKDCFAFCSGDVAAAGRLYIEIKVHQIHFLAFIINNKFSSEYQWATWLFFVRML